MLFEANHIYKRRRKVIFNKFRRLSWGNSGVYIMVYSDFEFVYLKLFRKICKRKWLKKKVRHVPPRYWLFITPDYIVSAKSKNSRMGCGVGLVVRALTKTLPGHILLEFRYFSRMWISRVVQAVRHRYPYKLGIMYR